MRLFQLSLFLHCIFDIVETLHSHLLKYLSLFISIRLIPDDRFYHQWITKHWLRIHRFILSHLQLGQHQSEWNQTCIICNSHHIESYHVIWCAVKRHTESAYSSDWMIYFTIFCVLIQAMCIFCLNHRFIHSASLLLHLFQRICFEQSDDSRHRLEFWWLFDSYRSWCVHESVAQVNLHRLYFIGISSALHWSFITTLHSARTQNSFQSSFLNLLNWLYQHHQTQVSLVWIFNLVLCSSFILVMFTKTLLLRSNRFLWWTYRFFWFSSVINDWRILGNTNFNNLLW
jgi:hypothetical protein